MIVRVQYIGFFHKLSIFEITTPNVNIVHFKIEKVVDAWIIYNEFDFFLDTGRAW